MLFPKTKRIVNRALLDEYRDYPCVCCNSSYGVSAHHLKTKGSGGNDVVDNLVPLCGVHHTEIHKLGEYTMKIKYPGLERFLRKIRE